MDGRARFALAQAQKEASRAAKAKKVGLAEDLYVDLQRNHRKLSRCRIRASEVHVKTTRHANTAGPKDWDLDLPIPGGESEWAQHSIVPRKPPTDQARSRLEWGMMAGNVQRGAGFALPNYILELTEELAEDDFELPDADRATPVSLGDLGLGLGDATVAAAAAAAACAAAAAATGCVTMDPSLGIASCPLAEISVTTCAASGTRPDTSTASRVGILHRDRLLPVLPKGSGKGVEKGVPKRPTMETMPQHLASDTYWVHRPVIVSAQQVRWEKKDGAQALISMRREMIPKICLDGLDRKRVQTAGAIPDQSGSPSALPGPGPAEAKIWAAESTRQEKRREGLRIAK